MLSQVFLFLDIGGGELVMILVAALLLFGGDKLPELAKGLGKGIRDFKDASEGVKREINNQIDNFDVKKRDEERAKKVAEEEPPVENDANRFIEEKSDENHYLANSVPISQDYITSTDQVTFEEEPKEEITNKNEEQLPVSEPVSVHSSEKKIF